MNRKGLPLALLLLLASLACAQGRQAVPASPWLLPHLDAGFITVHAPVIVLAHVRVIDGTGAPAVENQDLIIQAGKIRSITPAGQTTVPAGARLLDLAGDTVIPGMVGMHEHMFYPGPTGRGTIPGAPPMYPEMAFSFPRLYLASGVTSLRTTGSMEPYTDLEIKHYIDRGLIPGPKMHLTGPYLQGPGYYLPQLHALTGPQDAVRLVNYWADEGFTSFKAYQLISRAELGAAIQAAHARGLKVTGHLCSVTFPEAIQLGIDNLEHGLGTDTQFYPNKQPDVCPAQAHPAARSAEPPVNGPQIQALIRNLVAHHVAITSTLPVEEAGVPNRPPLAQRFLEVLSPPSRIDYLIARARASAGGTGAAARLRREMDFEFAFVKAGGTLLAGLDPTGNGGVVAGFGDQREVQLLVEAGFTPLAAIHIATQNGARFLGVADQLGSLRPGLDADLVVIRGNPAANIHDIENVSLVFKDGQGYDPQKLIASVRGMVGLR